ncbi:ATP-binding protein [Arthrobacter sp. YD4]|uniref:ATP-binding protein n=1 Tax=Arthrobacter sp. YD4 TaxID=3058043 RepID=UPI0025B3F507|nr:ATP-binding protein [Arthrobacter sp. YD4]MDN3935312.1 ATP-binding protein [Arthrobacter sp. YD4]
MGVAEIQVDQRVIGIDSRRFASVEKALVELITNSDESYARMERAGAAVPGRIRVSYERHLTGAVLTVADQAEGMSFGQARSILSYGGAHSPLARGEGNGRGYFGRGLKQAVFGLGHGWLETVQDGRFTRIDIFRGGNGGYLYDDGGGSRPALPADYARLGLTTEGPSAGHGTRVTIVVENPRVVISQHHTLRQSLANNFYLRAVLGRRTVELSAGHPGSGADSPEPVVFTEPAAEVLIGPGQTGSVPFEGRDYPFTQTVKRASGTELISRGDERTNGLVVLSGQAVLDCQLFDFENQVGTEYLFGEVRCDALTDMLGHGRAVISDEREGLNARDPFVAAFSRAVSAALAPAVLAEREKLSHLERATTSGRTAEMIEELLRHMNRAAVVDLGLQTEPEAHSLTPGTGQAAAGVFAQATRGADAPGAGPALRFTTPFYYRPPGHAFHVGLLLDPLLLPPGADFSVADLSVEAELPPSIHLGDRIAMVPDTAEIGPGRLVWTVTGDRAGDRGTLTARAGDHWATCEIVIAEQASRHAGDQPAHAGAAATPGDSRGRQRPNRDHGMDLFTGYEFRSLPDGADRAVYSAAERKVIINTAAPTVRLYVDGRGRFRDSARLLLAELFLDVIADELARRRVAQHGHGGDLEAFQTARRDIIRRYGSDVHRTFLG